MITYAEKLAIDVLNIRDRHGSMEEIIERIEQAMQAQRETCLAHYTAVYNEMIQGRKKPPINHIHNICQIAILNAEVKV